MADARRLDAWDRAGPIQMFLYNANAKPENTRPLSAFHPFVTEEDDAAARAAERKSRVIELNSEQSMAVLKSRFCPNS